MKRTVFILFICLALSTVGEAQDMIVKIDGTEIPSKVLEVNIDCVKYKKHSNLNGPTYMISKSELISINYENGEKDVFDKMPSFPGGADALLQFLKRNVKYPEICLRKGISGKVFCSFVVETDGSITNVTVVKSVDPHLDKEAVRVFQSMPKWIPGVENGKLVRVKYTVPLPFYIKEGY